MDSNPRSLSRRSPTGRERPGLPSAPPRPANVREGTCRLHVHFPKSKHRRDPAAWSGDLCEEPVTFRGGGAGVSCYGISSPPDRQEIWERNRHHLGRSYECARTVPGPKSLDGDRQEHQDLHPSGSNSRIWHNIDQADRV
jgi:hypothetical protein